tara:strand:+ start:760 stop:1008 length:249 start_codon:yes stop_codon:yes gene_type:complete
MSYVSRKPKTNNSIGDSFWQNVSQEWRFIDAITKNGLDFKIDQYALTQKLLKYSKPTYTAPSDYVAPTRNEVAIPTTTMTSV